MEAEREAEARVEELEKSGEAGDVEEVEAEEPRGPLRKLAALVEEFGGGFYGVGGALTFLVLEAKLLFEQWGALWRGAVDVGDVAGQVVTGWMFEIGVDSLLNGVWAMVWPAIWFRELETDALWLAAFLWLVCQVARKVVAAFWPQHSSLLREAAAAEAEAPREDAEPDEAATV